VGPSDYPKPPEPMPDFHGSGHLEWCEENDALGNLLKRTSDFNDNQAKYILPMKIPSFCCKNF